MDLDLIRDIILYRVNFASTILYDIEICAVDTSSDKIIVYFNMSEVEVNMSASIVADDTTIEYPMYLSLLRQKKLKEIGI